MVMFVGVLLLCCILQLACGEGPYAPSDSEAFYPINSLNNAGALFPLGGDIPASRVHHAVAVSSDYLFVYGGYASDGTFLGDMNLFYIPSQQWSGPIVRKQCCNRRGEDIESIGADGDLNFGENGDFPDVSAGFEGDAPLPRAEHTSCVLAEQMYTFGGVTEEYGLMNDLYKFDPVAVKWVTCDSSFGDSFPRRRAGHAMVCDDQHGVFYIFGGRTAQGTEVVGLNDVWRYDASKTTWTLLTRTIGVTGNAPGLRQYSSMLLQNGDLYLYGGINPASGLVYNDVWVFRIAVQQWQRLYSHRSGHVHTSTAQYPSGDATYQFAPPPLYLAHMLPVPESLDPTTGINTTFYGSDRDTSHVQNGGFLLYGGVGGGGKCGATQCGALETTMGQVYKFSLLEGTWTSPHTITGSVNQHASVNDPAHSLQYVQSSAWQYARLSSSPVITDAPALHSPGEATTALPFQGTVGPDSWNDRGKWIKTFAYEKVAFLPQRNVMYEVGGMIARRRTSAAPAEEPSVGEESLQVPRRQSTTLSAADVFARDKRRVDSVTPTGATPIKLDTASGSIDQPLWDRHTGEGLEEVIPLPANAFWDTTDGFKATALPEGAFKPIEFLRVFRTYTVSPSDLVLIKEDIA